MNMKGFLRLGVLLWSSSVMATNSSTHYGDPLQQIILKCRPLGEPKKKIIVKCRPRPVFNYGISNSIAVKCRPRNPMPDYGATATTVMKCRPRLSTSTFGLSISVLEKTLSEVRMQPTTTTVVSRRDHVETLSTELTITKTVVGTEVVRETQTIVKESFSTVSSVHIKTITQNLTNTVSKTIVSTSVHHQSTTEFATIPAAITRISLSTKPIPVIQSYFFNLTETKTSTTTVKETMLATTTVKRPITVSVGFTVSPTRVRPTVFTDFKVSTQYLSKEKTQTKTVTSTSIAYKTIRELTTETTTITRRQRLVSVSTKTITAPTLINSGTIVTRTISRPTTLRNSFRTTLAKEKTQTVTVREFLTDKTGLPTTLVPGTQSVTLIQPTTVLSTVYLTVLSTISVRVTEPSTVSKLKTITEQRPITVTQTLPSTETVVQFRPVTVTVCSPSTVTVSKTIRTKVTSRPPPRPVPRPPPRPIIGRPVVKLDSPLIFDMNQDGLISAIRGHGISMDRQHPEMKTGAATNGDQMLAMCDFSGNGHIDYHEVFGDGTRDPFTGRHLNAPNGFVALKEVALSAARKFPDLNIISVDQIREASILVDVRQLKHALTRINCDLGFISDDNVSILKPLGRVAWVQVGFYQNTPDSLENGISFAQKGWYLDEFGKRWGVDDVWFSSAT